MSATLLLGKPCVDRIADEIKVQLGDSRVKLYTIGFDDPKWKQYSNALNKSAQKFGFDCEEIFVSDNVTPQQFGDKVQQVCALSDCAGLIVQQPLPKEFANAVNFVDVNKDVDCLNPLSVAKLYCGQDGFRPATPLAVLRLLDFYGIDLQGKNLVIIGRGNAVGKPLALMALQRNATVTICHTKTVNLPAICRKADILVSACGVAGLVTEDFVTENSIVIDVGLSFVNGKTCGDVAPSVYDKCRAVSPVPGGVGPVTRAMLFENLLKAFKENK